jgi:hypothetical protein
VHSGEFRYLEAVMEADIEFATVVFALTFVMVFVVLGLSVIASMTDMYKFAHGEFGLLGSYTLYPLHERGLPLWCAIFRRLSCGRSSAPCSKRPVSAASMPIRSSRAQRARHDEE